MSNLIVILLAIVTAPLIYTFLWFFIDTIIGIFEKPTIITYTTGGAVAPTPQTVHMFTTIIN